MTPRQKQRIRALASKHTVPDIADRLGLRQHQVYRYCKLHGIEIVPMRGRLPKSDAVVRKLVVDLGSVERVATRFGVTPQAVYWRLRR